MHAYTYTYTYDSFRNEDDGDGLFFQIHDACKTTHHEKPESTHVSVLLFST